MSTYIFHGDDQVGSRKHLNILTAQLKEKGILIQSLAGKKITPAELEIAVATSNLFQKEAVLVEYLFSRPRSKDQKTCLAYLAGYQGDKDLILWDKKELTKTQLKLFPKAIIKLSKTPVLLWRLIDSFLPDSRDSFLTLMHETAQESDEGFIFIMLARRVSDLIIAKSGDTSKLQAWTRSRIIGQAQTWDEATLIEIHSELTKHDHALKTGGSKLSYLESLDMIISTSLC
jgi:hypothetical protein